MRLIIWLFAIIPATLTAKEMLYEQNKHIYIVSFETQPMSLFKSTINDNDLLTQHSYLLRNQRKHVFHNLSEEFNQPFKIIHDYINVLNGASLNLTEQQAAFLASIQGVKRVTKDYYLQTATDASASMVKADDIWLANEIDPFPASQGENIVVGIIDTGINFTHESFSDMPEDNYDFASSNPNGPGQFIGWCDPNHSNYDILYSCNNKYIGAWDFVDSFGNEDDGPLDNNFHGSHLSGVIASNYISSPPNGFEFSFNGGTLNAPFISGIAPHSHLIMYDVCDNTIGCPASAVLAAIDQAITDGVDIINMSLIGDINPWQENSISLALLNANHLGIITSTAAGNATAQQPDTYEKVSNLAPWVVTTANSYHGRTQSNDISVISDLPVAGFLMGIYSIISDGVTFVNNLESNILYSMSVDVKNESGCLAWNAQDFDNVVALIKSSSLNPECSNETKVQNAEDAGALAVVLFNADSNLPELITGINSPTIPATMIGLSDAENLISYIQDNSPELANIEIIAETRHKIVDELGLVLYHSSLRGPNNKFNVTKPDITAPGTNIFAAIAELGQPAPQYYTATGTSQSSAVISGSLALLKSLRPTLTPSELKSLIMLTAENDIKFDDGQATNSDDIGSGMLNLVNAVNSVLVMDESLQNYTESNPETGGEPEDLNLPSLRDNYCGNGCSWERTFTNIDSVFHKWEISTATDINSSLLVAPTNLSLRPGQSKAIQITYQPISGNLEERRYGQIFLKDTEFNLPDSQLNLVVYLNDLIFNNRFE